MENKEDNNVEAVLKEILEVSKLEAEQNPSSQRLQARESRLKKTKDFAPYNHNNNL